MKIIPIKGYQILVDDNDYDEIMKHKWHVCITSQGIYYARRWQCSGKKKKYIAMQRQIMKCPDELQVDHINHNTLDNRKENLRVVTKQQNCLNRRNRRNSLSKYLGVTKAGKKWTSRIKDPLTNKKLYLGAFETEIEAAIVRDRKAIELHGEYAYLNFK